MNISIRRAACGLAVFTLAAFRSAGAVPPGMYEEVFNNRQPTGRFSGGESQLWQTYQNLTENPARQAVQGANMVGAQQAAQLVERFSAMLDNGQAKQIALRDPFLTPEQHQLVEQAQGMLRSAVEEFRTALQSGTPVKQAAVHFVERMIQIDKTIMPAAMAMGGEGEINPHRGLMGLVNNLLGSLGVRGFGGVDNPILAGGRSQLITHVPFNALGNRSGPGTNPPVQFGPTGSGGQNLATPLGGFVPPTHVPSQPSIKPPHDDGSKTLHTTPLLKSQEKLPGVPEAAPSTLPISLAPPSADLNKTHTRAFLTMDAPAIPTVDVPDATAKTLATMDAPASTIDLLRPLASPAPGEPDWWNRR